MKNKTIYEILLNDYKLSFESIESLLKKISDVIGNDEYFYYLKVEFRDISVYIELYYNDGNKKLKHVFHYYNEDLYLNISYKLIIIPYQYYNDLGKKMSIDLLFDKEIDLNQLYDI